jgi:ABC-type transport system involved in multi-copper enzyme maturation permease subunit
MIGAIRTELAKLRTMRMTWGLLATGAGLSALFSVLEANQAGTKGGGGPSPLYTASGFGAVVTGGVWGLLFAMVIGVTVVTAEFRHQTITPTYLGTPHRNRVLAAKLAAGALAGALSGLAAFLIVLGSALGFTLSRGYTVPVGDATLARYGIGHVLAGALLAAIGVCVGALVRSQLAGIVAVFVWSIILESLVGGLFPATRPYLPYTAASSLAGDALGGGAFGPAHDTSGGTPLPFAATVALLAAMTIMLALVSVRTSVRRDVT